MRNDFDDWVKGNQPPGRYWTGKLLSLTAAGTAAALVGLSVVLTAGLGLPAGDVPAEARAPAGQNVRYAEALPTVTVVGRREPAPQAALTEPTSTAALPAVPASGEAATVGMSGTGDNLRQ